MIRLNRLLLQGSVIIGLLVGIAYPQNPSGDDTSRLKTLNAEVLEKFKAGNLEDALAASKKVVELTIKMFGKDHTETAVAFSNLGELYSLKQKDEPAFDNFYSSWSIHKQSGFVNPDIAGKVLVRLAQLSVSAKRPDPLRIEAEGLMALAESENAPSKRIYNYILSALTLLYAYDGRIQKADEIFLKRYAAFKSLTPQNIAAFEGLENDRLLFEISFPDWNQNDKRTKEFEAKLRLQDGDDLIYDGVFYRARKSEVVNGQALSIGKLDYPIAAKSAGARGRVIVKVLISEDGRVIHANAISGSALLRFSCERAAKEGRFSETKLGGKPMKVRGRITCNFVQ